jgi:hypothetical protein
MPVICLLRPNRVTVPSYPERGLHMTGVSQEPAFRSGCGSGCYHRQMDCHQTRTNPTKTNHNGVGLTDKDGLTPHFNPIFSPADLVLRFSRE